MQVARRGTWDRKINFLALFRLYFKERGAKIRRQPQAVRRGPVLTAASRGSTAGATAGARLSRSPGAASPQGRGSRRSRQPPVSLLPTMWDTAKLSVQLIMTSVTSTTVTVSQNLRPGTSSSQQPPLHRPQTAISRYRMFLCSATPAPWRPLGRSWSPAVRTLSIPK